MQETLVMNKAGVSLWRQIGETLAEEIEQGVFAADERLPPAADLAVRFSVNRHTVLKAISHLQSEGLVRIERGRGAHALVNPVQFRLGARHFFEQNLRENNLTPSRKILFVRTITASPEVASALKVSRAAKVIYVAVLGVADGIPINLSYGYFPPDRMPGIDDIYRELMEKPNTVWSTSKIYRKVGVKDFRRKRMRIRCRPPTREEAQHLKVGPNEYVLVTYVHQVDLNDNPVAYSETCYCGSRSEFVLDL